jgi:hypothetical protein
VLVDPPDAGDAYEVAIYVAGDFLPLTFVAMVSRPTPIWFQRLAEGLLSVISSKFVLAASFARAIDALGRRTQDKGMAAASPR